MPLLDLIKRLLGIGIGQADFVRPVAPVVTRAQPAAVAAPLMPKAPNFGLMREELFNRQACLTGFRFSPAQMTVGTTQARQDYLTALRHVDVKRMGSRRLIVIEIRPFDFTPEQVASISAAQLVFLLRPPPDQPLSADTQRYMQQIREAGAQVGLCWSDGGESLGHAWLLASHAFIDMASLPVSEFEQTVTRMRRRQPSLQWVVENVHTWWEQRLCLGLGAGHTMGRFLMTVDEKDKTARLTRSQEVLISMLNMVRNDANFQDIADEAKKAPDIAVQLLSMANAPAYGLPQPLTSMDQAITVLGREVLYRWLAISVFRSGSERPQDQALLEVSLTRARFLELAGGATLSAKQADELFLVGLLSYIDCLLGIPLADILQRMSVPGPVSDVLLRNQGPYVEWVLLAMAMERRQTERVEQLSHALHLPSHAIAAWRHEAAAWAEEAASLSAD